MSNKKDLVSVIVPVYKVEKYLKRCVESILVQTYENIEIVLVDDGSPDTCPEICNELAKTDKRIKVIHKENGGLSSARLAGFRESKGIYILFVDSDDYIESNMVEELFTAITQKDASLALCGYVTQYENRKIDNPLPYTESFLGSREEIEKKYILPLIGPKKNNIILPGFVWIRMMRRELIKESFFVPENTYFAEDVVMDLLYSDALESVSIVNKLLYHYCVNGQSLTNKYRQNKWQMLKNLYAFKRDFLIERKIAGATERLNNAIASSVFASVDNAVLSGSYKTYIKEITALLKDAKDIVKKADKNPLHGTIPFTMFFLSMRAYFVVYCLRKSRINRH